MNAQVNTETKARRTGGRGRGAATASLAASASGRKRGAVKADPNWHLPANELSALGTEMAQAAVQQVQTGVNFWDRVRTQYIAAQDHGRTQEALVAIFKPGEAVKGRKAPWYRTYKSILTAASDRGLTVAHDTGVTALQALIKESKEKEVEADPEKREAKAEQLLGMFERLAAGCLNFGIPKKDLAKRLAELEV